MLNLQKGNCRLIRGTNITWLYAYDASVPGLKILEVFKQNPLVIDTESLITCKNGNTVFWYTTNRPTCKNWKLEVFGVIHESMNPTDKPMFEVPFVLNKFIPRREKD